MKKTSNTRNERLFSPELKEVIRRLKHKEPELEAVVDPDRQDAALEYLQQEPDA